MQLSIIIVSYNTKDLTITCIESIIKQYKKELEKKEFELIIVDNGSADGSVEAISNFQFPISNFQLINNKENLGFSKANNIGAKTAKGEYLFFLNSDTEIKDAGLLGMIDFLDKNYNVGILGGKLKNIDNSIQRSVGKFYNLRNVFLMLIGGERVGLLRSAPNKLMDADWVSGASMMIRKKLFKKLGGFDEKLFMYMEDMDLSFRIKKSGFRVSFYPNIEIIHKERGSSNRQFAIINIYKGLLYFYKKHNNYLEYLLLKVMLFSKAFIAIGVGFLTNNIYLKNTYKEALKF